MGFLSFLKSFSPFKAKTAPGAPASFVDKIAQRMPLETTAVAVAEPFGTQPEPVSREEEAKIFARDEIDSFLHFGTWLKVQSTDVDEIQYDADNSQLTIKFLDKGRGSGYYQYEDVSIREAESFAKAASKGRWVWRVLRVLGKGNFWAYRKPYALLSGVSSYKPRWMRSASIRKLHGKIGPEGLRNKKWAKVLMPRNTKT